MALIYFKNNYLTLYYHATESLGHPVWKNSYRFPVSGSGLLN
ncbi:MAG: hypothetical protein JWQ14_1843 [Adhaeribacter sp.]|nr:hypothetical protein [Adhaeribacter sp.]